MEFSNLRGQTIKRIAEASPNSSYVLFEMANGSQYRMYHVQDCCESVEVYEVDGSPEDITDAYVHSAYAASGDDAAPIDGEPDGFGDDSHTWTFYRLQTNKGCLVIRWLGQSNGYYSEAVSFEQVK